MKENKHTLRWHTVNNLFCSLSDLTNEASVETWFIDPLLKALGYTSADIALKTSIREYRVGRGSKSELYKPDYILSVGGIPSVVIDAKAPSEDIEKWKHQCSSYCLKLNQLFDYYNPVQLFVLSNGLKTSIYRWDYADAILTVTFSQFLQGHPEYLKLHELLQREVVKNNTADLKVVVDETPFSFKQISLVVCQELCKSSGSG